MVSKGLTKITLKVEDVLNEFSDKELADLLECLVYKIKISEITDNEFSLVRSNLDMLKSQDQGIREIPRETLIKKIIENYGHEEFRGLAFHLYNSPGIKGTSLEDLIKAMLNIKFGLQLERLKSTKYKEDVVQTICRSYFIKSKDLYNFMMGLVILGYLGEGTSGIENPETRASITNEITEKIFEYYVLYQEKKNRQNQTALSTTRNNLKQIEKEKLELKERYEKEKELRKRAESQTKDLARKIDEMLKIPGNPELMHKMQESLDKKDKTIERLINDLAKLKEEPSKTNSSLVESLTREKAELKAIINEKNSKIRELSAELRQYIDTNAFIRKYLSSLEANESVLGCIPESVQEYIYQTLQTKMNPMGVKDSHIPRKENPETEVGRVADEFTTPEHNYKIGACLLENGVHYVMFPDGSRHEIENLRQTAYLANGQLVRVDLDNNFIEAFSAITEDVKKESNIYYYGPVIIVNNVPHIEREDGRLYKITEMSSWVWLRQGQVISVGNNNNLKRFYKPVKVSLDNYYDSIKAKGHRAAFVLKKIGGMYLARDIETDEEQLLTFDNENTYTIEEQEVIVYKEKEILRIFQNSKVYTKSKYYKKSCYATIENMDGDVLARKFNREVIIVRGVPISLQVGQVIRIDEFGNYLETIATTEDLPQNTIPKAKQKKTQEDEDNKQEKTILPPDAKTVAVIGDKRMQDAYAQALLKEGYRICMIDGYQSYASVKREMNGSDIIIIIAKYVAHDNWWNIKRDYPEKFRLSEHDGANRIVELVKSINKEG